MKGPGLQDGTHLTGQQQAQVAPVLLPEWLYLRGSSGPSSGLISLLEQLPELTDAVYLLDQRLIMQGCNSGAAGWQRRRGRGVGQAQSCPVVSRGPLSLISRVQHPSSVDTVLSGFTGRPHTGLTH